MHDIAYISEFLSDNSSVPNIVIASTSYIMISTTTVTRLSRTITESISTGIIILQILYIMLWI